MMMMVYNNISLTLLLTSLAAVLITATGSEAVEESTTIAVKQRQRSSLFVSYNVDYIVQVAQSYPSNFVMEFGQASCWYTDIA